MNSVLNFMDQEAVSTCKTFNNLNNAIIFTLDVYVFVIISITPR